MASFTQDKIIALCERGEMLQRKANYNVFQLSHSKTEPQREELTQSILAELFEIKGIFKLIIKAVENGK